MVAITDDAPIAIYGASGYSGRLVASELARRGHEGVLAGRSATRLRATARALELGWPVRVALLDDRAALVRAIAGCAAVVNCAGPFMRCGTPVIEAALEAGVHYLDITGEQPYMRRVFAEFDAPARERSLAVIPAVGFDDVLGDLLAHVVARDRGSLREVVLAYDVNSTGISRASLRSVLEVLKDRDIAFLESRSRPFAAASFDFPQPIGPRPVFSYPGGEMVTVPRHVDTRKLAVVFTLDTFAPHRRLAPLVPLSASALGKLLRSSLVSGLAERIIDWMPDGPSEPARRASRFTIVAEATGEDGRSVRAILRGSDHYGSTATIAVHASEIVAAGGLRRVGVLAPAEAFDADRFLDDLCGQGMSLVRVADSWDMAESSSLEPSILRAGGLHE